MSLSHSSDLYIIAECAQGYSASSITDSVNLAIWLVKSAKAAGADAVKFQLVIADELATPDYKHYELFKSLELEINHWLPIASCANELSIDLVFDVFGRESLSLASILGANLLNFIPLILTTHLLNAVAEHGSFSNVIAGCGGSSKKELFLLLTF